MNPAAVTLVMRRNSRREENIGNSFSCSLHFIAWTTSRTGDQSECQPISADPFGCEQAYNQKTGGLGLLHAALLCNLGVIFNEIVWLKDLADDCAKAGPYTSLFAGTPLK
jgi:hypothetical protein